MTFPDETTRSGAGPERPALPHPLTELDDDTLRGALRLRIASVDALPSLDGLPHVRAVGPGVVEVLTFDLPETIVMPTVAEVAHLGAVPLLVDLGRQHLRDVLDGDVHLRDVRTDDGLTFSFVHGEDYSVSSLALVLPELLLHVAPDRDTDKGVAVAVPDRQHLAFRTIDGLPSLMAVGPMAAFARNGFESGDGVVSPDVFWARGPRLDRWERLTGQQPDGIEIHVPAELTAAVEAD